MIKNHVIKYCVTVNEGNGKNIFWFIKNSGVILSKLKSKGFLGSNLSTYDFSTTLDTALPRKSNNLFHSLCPSQKIYSYGEMGFPGMNQN